MKIQTFNVTDFEKANDFMQSVVMVEDGAVQVAGNNIVIFYKDTKEQYRKTFIAEMIESLKRNLYHEQVRQVAIQADVEVHRDKGGKADDVETTLERSRQATDNIRKFEAKITALEEWAKNI